MITKAKNPTGTFLLVLVLSVLTAAENVSAQFQGINDSIAKYRKGIINIRVKKGDRISIEQLSHEFWFGCAISNGLGTGKMSEADLKNYKEKFLENFNSTVTENAVKWGDMERNKGEVNYSVIDGILAWTESVNIPIRGHNLFWGIEQFIQPWVKELSDEELKETIRKRAETITAKYKGRFVEYDLNNEMIHGNYYEKRLGRDITKQMAEWARKGDPDVRLFLNDYDILTGRMLPQYMAQIRDLLKQGVPIAGIGVQGHLHGDSFDRNELRRALDSLSIFGLPIRITEFNMPGQRSKYYTQKITTMTPEEEEFNAKEMVDYYRICFAHPSVKGILMWGFWAGANWIPVSSLYRRDWSPTPAAEAYKKLVFGEWWTRESVNAAKKGMLSVPAFFGRYRITVNGKSKEFSLSSSEGELNIDATKL